MEKSLISAITVTYNSAKTVSKTIESVLNQTYPALEYTIVDGLSSDNTVEIAESYRKAFEDKGIKYTVISEKDNNMYEAINKGIDRSTGVIIGNVNSDDFYEPDCFEKVAKTYEKTKFGMLYGNLRIIKPTGNVIKKAKIKKFLSTRYWNHPTTFITKEVYDKYRYKCESLYDDCDLMIRIRKSEFKTVIIDEILSNFVFGGMSTRKSLKETIHRIQMRCKVYKDNDCGILYYIDSIIIEFGKYILG